MMGHTDPIFLDLEDTDDTVVSGGRECGIEFPICLLGEPHRPEPLTQQRSKVYKRS